MNHGPNMGYFNAFSALNLNNTMLSMMVSLRYDGDER